METVLIRGGGGWELPHDLPLPAGLASRVESGEATNLGPCDGDGNLLDVPDAKPEPEPADPKLRLKGRTQDDSGQSADDDAPALSKRTVRH